MIASLFPGQAMLTQGNTQSTQSNQNNQSGSQQSGQAGQQGSQSGQAASAQCLQTGQGGQGAFTGMLVNAGFLNVSNQTSQQNSQTGQSNQQGSQGNQNTQGQQSGQNTNTNQQGTQSNQGSQSSSSFATLMSGGNVFAVVQTACGELQGLFRRAAQTGSTGVGTAATGARATTVQIVSLSSTGSIPGGASATSGTLINANQAIDFTWNAVPGANAYRVSLIQSRGNTQQGQSSQQGQAGQQGQVGQQQVGINGGEYAVAFHSARPEPQPLQHGAVGSHREPVLILLHHHHGAADARLSELRSGNSADSVALQRPSRRYYPGIAGFLAERLTELRTERQFNTGRLRYGQQSLRSNRFNQTGWHPNVDASLRFSLLVARRYAMTQLWWKRFVLIGGMLITLTLSACAPALESDVEVTDQPPASSAPTRDAPTTGVSQTAISPTLARTPASTPTPTRPPITPTDQPISAFTPLTAAPPTQSVDACMQSGCDDGDPCTVDICNPVYGCSHTPVTCTDPNACIVDICENGICVLVDTSSCTASP